MFPPFPFLSLQPYRNRAELHETNTHKITMKTDVSKKEKMFMRCLLCMPILSKVLVQSMKSTVHYFSSNKLKGRLELRTKGLGGFFVWLGFFFACTCLRFAFWLSDQEFQTSSPKMQFSGEVHAKFGTQTSLETATCSPYFYLSGLWAWAQVHFAQFPLTSMAP